MKDERGRKWGPNSLEFLKQLIRNSVVTETELMQICGKSHRASYRDLVRFGFPIRRRVLENIGSGKQGVRTRISHRTVIYYLAGRGNR